LGFLCGPDKKRIVSNPKTAGQPRYETLSGNKLTSGYASEHQRNHIAIGLKDFYRPFIRKMKPFTKDDFPIRIEWDFYTTVDTPNFDMDNFWFYLKYFLDTLKEGYDPRDNRKYEPIIPDDNIRYITHPASPRLIPVTDFEDRKFVFRFYRDNRKEILDHNLWEKASNTPFLLNDPPKDLLLSGAHMILKRKPS
jgi:hypothetical protein